MTDYLEEILRYAQNAAQEDEEAELKRWRQSYFRPRRAQEDMDVSEEGGGTMLLEGREGIYSRRFEGERAGESGLPMFERSAIAGMLTEPIVEWEMDDSSAQRTMRGDRTEERSIALPAGRSWRGKGEREGLSQEEESRTRLLRLEEREERESPLAEALTAERVMVAAVRGQEVENGQSVVAGRLKMLRRAAEYHAADTMQQTKQAAESAGEGGAAWSVGTVNVRSIDREIERDARRYDSGFGLY